MYFQKTYRVKVHNMFFFSNSIMIKVLVGLLFLLIFLYLGFTFLNQEKDDIIDLNVGHVVNADTLGLNSNRMNFKEFSHSFWINIGDLSNNATGLQDTSYNILKHESYSGQTASDNSRDLLRVALVDGRKLVVYFHSVNDNNDARAGNYPEYSLVYDNFPLQTWVNVVIVKSINDLDLYINSTLVKTMQVSQSYDVRYALDGGVTLGEATQWVGLEGKMTGYKYFVQALNQDEVSNAYKSLLSRFPGASGGATVKVPSYNIEVDINKNKQNVLNAKF